MSNKNRSKLIDTKNWQLSDGSKVRGLGEKGGRIKKCQLAITK